MLNKTHNKISAISKLYRNFSTEWYLRVGLFYSKPISKKEQRKFLGLLAAGLLCLNLYAPASPTLIERVLASAIIIVTSIPLFLWLSGKERRLPFLIFFGGIYSIYYALPIFLLNKFSRAYYINTIIPHAYIEKALIYSLLGFGALFLGYYSFIKMKFNNKLPKLKFDWRPIPHTKYIASLMGILGILTFYLKIIFKIPLPLQQAAEFVENLSLISMVILFILQLVGKLRLFDKFFLLGLLVPTRIILAMGTGATAQILEVILILAIAYTSINHRIPLKILIIGVILFALLRSAQIPYRAIAWSSATEFSVREKISLYLLTINDILSGNTDGPLEIYDVGTSRLAHLMTFADVIMATPDYVPYWKGGTYYPLFFKIIPRILYPDKPLEITGQEFGHRYSFLSPNDYITSYNLPQLIEFYANFGFLGVILGMFLLGIFYNTIQHLFFHRRMGLGALVALIYISAKLLLIESALSMVVGGIFWIIIFFGFLHIIINVMRPGLESI